MIDYFVLTSIILRTVSIGMLLAYVVPRQVREVRRPRDQFTSLRWLVFHLIVFFVLASSPVLIYQGSTLSTHHTAFQQIASIANGLASLAVGVVLMLIYNYRYEE